MPEQTPNRPPTPREPWLDRFPFGRAPLILLVVTLLSGTYLMLDPPRRFGGTLDQPVHDIRFEGLTFADATWLRPSRRGHHDVQASFVMRLDNMIQEREGGTVASRHGEWLRSPANVLVQTGRAIRFEACTFTRLGGAGLDLQHGARDNVVEGCAFHDISGAAIPWNVTSHGL